eukprot:4982966-Lingulodinium_polyedra.AAC.1
MAANGLRAFSCTIASSLRGDSASRASGPMQRWIAVHGMQSAARGTRNAERSERSAESGAGGARNAAR